MKRLGQQLKAIWSWIRIFFRDYPLAALLLLVILVIILVGYVTRSRGIGMWEYEHQQSQLVAVGYKSLWDWLELLLIPIAVGIGTLYLTRHLETQQRKTETTLKLAEEFNTRTGQFGPVYGLLNAGRPLTPEESIRVKGIGNWFDKMALLSEEKWVNDDLLNKLGLRKILLKFHTRVATCKDENIRGLLKNEWLSISRFTEKWSDKDE